MIHVQIPLPVLKEKTDLTFKWLKGKRITCNTTSAEGKFSYMDDLGIIRDRYHRQITTFQQGIVQLEFGTLESVMYFGAEHNMNVDFIQLK